jgi:hypothetical protein
MKPEELKIVEEETPAETLDLVIVEKSVGYLQTNIRGLELYVENKLKEYTPEKFKGDADLAKKKRAELNKAKDILNEKRKAIIKECMKPFEDFDERCKSLVKQIDSASGSLDEIVKLKEQEEKDKKRKQIERFWQSKNFDLFPLEKIFNQKWLNKTYKESDILDDMDKRIEKTYKDLKTLETYSDMYGIKADDVKAHYLMNLDVEETVSYCDELQRQKEIAQREAKERAEREHEKAVGKQKEDLWIEECNYERKTQIDNLAEEALAECEGTEIAPKTRKMYTITVKAFDEDLIRIKGELNKLDIEFTVEELLF